MAGSPGDDGEPPGEPYFLAFPVAGLLALALVALLVGFRAPIADRRVKRHIAPATRQSAN